jgi:hypothetical protein
MRNFKKLLYFLVFMLGWGCSEGQSWYWVQKEPTVGADIPYGDHPSVTDGYGNTFLASMNDLVKFDYSGNVVWYTSTLNYLHGFPLLSVAIYSQGEYGAGYFQGNLVFDSDTLKCSNFSYSALLAKYNSFGSPVWAKQGSNIGNGISYGYSVTSDINGNVYLTGIYAGIITFDNDTLNSNSYYKTFIVKYDSSGNLKWCRSSKAGSVSIANVNSVSSDSIGNIYLTGAFARGNFSFGNDTIFNIGPREAFYIVKFDSAGNEIWTKSIRSDSCGSMPYSIASDKTGNSYVSGVIDGEGSLFIGNDTLVNKQYGGPYPNFFARFDANGKAMWGKEYATMDSSYWALSSVACNNYGNCYLLTIGEHLDNMQPYFMLKVGFDTFKLASTYEFQSAGVLLQYDSSGNFQCGSIYSDGGEDDGDAISVSHSGQYIYLIGDLYQDGLFGADTIVNTHFDSPLFLARWQSCGDTNIETSTPPISNPPSLSLFPNPNNGAFTLASVGTQNFVPAIVEIYNVMGEKVFTSTPTLLPHSMGGASVSYPINISYEPSGIYLYRVMDESGALVGEGKFVIGSR